MKKPAHEVVFEMISQTLEGLAEGYFDACDSQYVVRRMQRIECLLEVLGSIEIPQSAVETVISLMKDNEGRLVELGVGAHTMILWWETMDNVMSM